jgi:hypothetical protein
MLHDPGLTYQPVGPKRPNHWSKLLVKKNMIVIFLSINFKNNPNHKNTIHTIYKKNRRNESKKKKKTKLFLVGKVFCLIFS